MARPSASLVQDADVSHSLSPNAVSKEPAGDMLLIALCKWCICQKKNEQCYDLVTVA